MKTRHREARGAAIGCGGWRKEIQSLPQRNVYIIKDQTVKTGIIYETSTLVRVVSEVCEGTQVANIKGDVSWGKFSLTF